MKPNNPFAPGASAIPVDEFLADMGREQVKPQDTFREDFNLGERKVRDTALPAGYQIWDGERFTKTGAYLDVPAEFYHGAEPCDVASISATGLKKLAGNKAGQTKGCTPRHYWHDSPLNPKRKPQVDKAHFRVGRAAHDVVLLSDRWPEFYHVTPPDFSRAKTKAMADEIAEADAAIEAGMTVLSVKEAEMVQAMAAALRADELASAVLTNGESEVTLVWTDKETGVRLRARPDFLPTKRLIIPDLKAMADGSYDGFQKAIKSNGYAQAAAHYLDGIEAVFGERPTNWLHVVIEKAEPYVISLFELPAEDIERGRWLNRRAIRVFAECLAAGTEAKHWPGYTTEPVMCGLPGWARKVIDEGGDANEVIDTPQGWMSDDEDSEDTKED